MTDGPDPYKVLQVDSEAEDEVIQAAYRRLAQKYHPDVAPGPEAAVRMAAINVAWETLRDPGRRAAFDLARRLERRAAERRAGAGPETPMPPARSSPGAPPPSGARPAEAVSSDWSTGRSSQGSGYDPSQMRTADALGAAGPPPGDPAGSVLTFGRYAGWSLGEISRRDLEYVEALVARKPIAKERARDAGRDRHRAVGRR